MRSIIAVALRALNTAEHMHSGTKFQKTLVGFPAPARIRLPAITAKIEGLNLKSKN